jgi:hypothetical protein
MFSKPGLPRKLGMKEERLADDDAFRDDMCRERVP